MREDIGFVRCYLLPSRVQSADLLQAQVLMQVGLQMIT